MASDREPFNSNFVSSEENDMDSGVYTEHGTPVTIDLTLDESCDEDSIRSVENEVNHTTPPSDQKQSSNSSSTAAVISVTKKTPKKKAPGSRPKKPPRVYHGSLEKTPDMNKEEFERRKEIFLEELKKTPSEIRRIERATVNQASSTEWRDQRKIRLTASMFGQVCKMKPITHCRNIVTSLLYSKFKGNEATDYGKQHEGDAVRTAEIKLKVKVVPCGLFIDQENPFLGASPDGLIDEDGILEIKCPYVVKDSTPADGIHNNRIKSCVFDEQGNLQLRRNHNYYYQVQGQLNITKRKYCYFVLWSKSGMLYEKIERDTQFWANIIDKLKEFYMQCILPELVDPRERRDLDMRDRVIAEQPAPQQSGAGAAARKLTKTLKKEIGSKSTTVRRKRRADSALPTEKGSELKKTIGKKNCLKKVVVGSDEVAV